MKERFLLYCSSKSRNFHELSKSLLNISQFLCAALHCKVNVSHKQAAKLRAINTTLRVLPKNATHLCQPADSFVIQKIKQRWRKLWDEEKVRLINSREWQEGLLKSGTLPNPGKIFFLRLVARVVREVNKMRDKKGLSYARNL